MASGNPAIELASTLQMLSINRRPDPRHDIDPSTAASAKLPVHVSAMQCANEAGTYPSDIDDEIPLSALRPVPRTQQLPPLPDMRFEQSYLARIAPCTSTAQVAWVTLFDHVFMPLAQGVVWNLIVFGWRAWNTEAKFLGRGVGARLRRWWWAVNGWELPRAQHAYEPEMAPANKVREFYEAEFGSAGGD